VITEKPLGGKAYGSIPHLPGSRLGPGDHKLPDGAGAILTEKLRTKHETVIVQEKLDGSCVAVALVGGVLYPLSRAGYLATTSPYRMHQMFDAWVWRNQDRFKAALGEGERLCGEWLVQAHGTRYDLPHEPFVAFDLMRGNVNSERAVFSEFAVACEAGGFVTPRVIAVHDGTETKDGVSVEYVQSVLEPSGHGALDPVEGAVWRLEDYDHKRGRRFVNIIAKWVRADKVDGCYLPTEMRGEPVWNKYE